jgi:hypothetical protein
MIGITDNPIPDQTIVDLWNQSFYLVPQFTQTISYTDLQDRPRHFTHGGCVMSSINPTDSGMFDLSQTIRDSIVFKERSIINQDSTSYFYGGILENQIADLSGHV